MNHIQRKRITVPIAIVIALAITPALSGCFANPIQQIVEGATGGNVNLGGGSLPKGFPADVPVIDGEIIFGLGLGNDTDGRGWNVTIKVSGVDAIDTITSQLTAAGFTQNLEGIGGTTDDGATAIFESDKYGVLVVVAKDSDNGYIASYTVSETNN